MGVKEDLQTGQKLPLSLFVKEEIQCLLLVIVNVTFHPLLQCLMLLKMIEESYL